MRNYRSQSDSESSDDDRNVTTASKAQPSQPTEAYLQFIAAYENNYADEDASFTEQTIEEEYNTYVASVPNLKRQATSKLDPLKFWEVSTIFTLMI